MNIHSDSVFSSTVKLENNLGAIQKSPFSSLPYEIINKIFSYLEEKIEERCRLLTVCKVFLNLILNDDDNIYGNVEKIKFSVQKGNFQTFNHIFQNWPTGKSWPLRDLITYSICYKNNCEITKKLFANKDLRRFNTINIHFMNTVNAENVEFLKILLEDPETEELNPNFIFQVLNNMPIGKKTEITNLIIKHPKFARIDFFKKA